MARKLNRRQVLGGIGAAGTLSVAGCLEGNGDPIDDEDDNGGDAPGTDPSGRDVLHGILMSETGDLGELGSPIADAADLPRIQLENADSPITVDTQREDTETLSETGIARAEDIVAGGNPSLTGSDASDVTIPVAESVAIPEQTPMISPASTAPGITELDGNYVLRTAPSDALQGAVMGELAYQDQGWETAATMHTNDAYGQALNAEFKSAFEDEGGEVLAEEPFEPEQSSYTSALQSALEEDPDFLMLVAFPVSGIQIFRDFYGEFEEIPVMVTDGLIEDDLPNDVDNPMDNVIGTSPGAAGPEVDAFNQLYEDEYGTGPGVFNAQAYDASAVQILANLRAGENDGSAVAEQIREVTDPGGEVVGPSNFPEAAELAADAEEIEYQGASSEVVFDENGDMTAVSYDIYEFGDYELEVTRSIDFEN